MQSKISHFKSAMTCCLSQDGDILSLFLSLLIRLFLLNSIFKEFFLCFSKIGSYGPIKEKDDNRLLCIEGNMTVLTAVTEV
jgi:hypothetical protein